MTSDVKIQANLHYVPGFIHGLQQPALHLNIVAVDGPLDLHHAQKQLTEWIAVPADDRLPQALAGATDLASYLSFWCAQILRVCRIAPVAPAVLFSHASLDHAVHLYQPVIAPINALLAQWIACLCDLLDAKKTIETKRFAQLKTQIAHFASHSTNTPHFLRAAQTLTIQVEQIAQAIYQFGQANRSYLLESSFTEHTSNIASKLARSKLDAARLMRQMGLPIPDNSPVSSLEQALHLAEKLQYPVVIKPISLDGGHGVFAHLQNATQLTKAYHAAKAISPDLMLEKHIAGRDYRLTVFRGRLVWAIERVPASVVGDGIHSVEQLVAMVNQDDRRGTHYQQSLKKIQLDDESTELLASVGLSLAAVPAKGQFVILKRKSNVNVGGMPVAVTERVHPDNARLAVQAAIALRLDFAGIDLIMPDIEKSYLEVGGGICEINAQPQLGSITASHLYPEILQEMLPQFGRIAIDVFVADDRAHPSVQAITQDTQVSEFGTGFYDGDYVYISGHRLTRDRVSAFQAGKQLILSKNVLRIVMIITPTEWLSTGSPFLTFDSLNVLALHQEASIMAAKVLVNALRPCYTTLRVDDALQHVVQ